MEQGPVVASAAPAPLAALSDAALVQRVRGGEPEQFEALIRRHNPRVYRAIRALIRDEAEVEDAMQQTYLLAYSRLDAFAGEAAFSTWLTRIAINEALGRLRRTGRSERLSPLGDEGPAEAEDGSPEVRAAAREAMTLLRRAIDRLAPPHRVVFMLRDVEELSTADTAAILGLSSALVKVRLFRARHALRRALAGAAGRSLAEAFPFLAPRCDRVTAGVMPRLR